MSTKLLTIITFFIVHVTGQPEITTTVSKGVNSLGFNVVYGDEDLSILNQVVQKEDKLNSKKINLNEAISPLPPQDVKCLMSVDRYCSKEMGELKSVLVQAVKEDCEKCTVEDKERAGKLIASLMAHDPVAWKLFLTRSALQRKKREAPPPTKELKFRVIGEGEEVVRSSKNIYAMPGIKVRVRRYATELIP